jgi:RNA polymerase sigma-70 factor (ECF subfamily)
MQRENQDWLTDLNSSGEPRESALADLHGILLRILPNALARYLDPTSSHFDAFMEDVVQETLLRVLDRLDTFQGRSKFTTWVYKIAINVALSELRLRKWTEVSLDGLNEGRDPDQRPSVNFESSSPQPETFVERQDAIALVMKIMDEELTPRQRAVMEAVHLQGVPMDVVAQRTNSNRNAVYKMMHDARLRLKHRLEREGLSPEDLLAVFTND